jgi:predicted outer membrane repeat protein
MKYSRSRLSAFIRFAFLLIVLFAPSVSTSAVIYVNHAATGANNGASWTNAYVRLETALAAANASDEIWVAQGLYKPTTGTDRTATFLIQDNNLSLYGGFAGGETQRNQRNWTNHVTVLSGDLGGDDTTDVHGVVHDWSDIVGMNNCYNVMDARGLTFTLDGFTVTAGRADRTDTRCPPAVGAGLFVLYGTTTLRNDVFIGNYGDLQPGGAIYFWADGSGNGTVSNVSFIGNAGSQGGAVHVRTGTYRFENCLFQDNEARDPLDQSGTALVGGGGLFASGSGNAVINGRFIGNICKDDGAGLYASDPMTISNVLFQGNYAAENAGGMWDENGSQLTDVRFLTNSAGVRGGGMVTRQAFGVATGVYTRVLFQANSAQRGGGIYSEVGSPFVYNSAFIGNSASEGGAVWDYYANPKLINTVIRGNSGTYGSAFCGMFGVFTLTGVTIYGNNGSYLIYDYTSSDTLSIRNSIIWGNGGTVYSGDVTVNARYSIVQGGCPGGWTCDHILNVDPQFVNAAAGDLHLSPSSPAIDAGDNLVTNPSLPSTDLDGYARRADITFCANTGNGTSPFVDLGAYEAQMGPHAITATAGPTGAGTASGSGSYTFGNAVTVKVTAAQGYRFINWCEGGQALSLQTNYIFTATGARTLMAVLDPIVTSNDVSTAWYRGYNLGPATGVAWTPAQWTALDGTCSSGNGTPNWQAYYADLNPTNPASRFLVIGVSNTEPLQVFFNPSSTGRVYTLQYCDDPKTGTWNNVVGQVDIRGGTNWLSDASGSAVRIYRVNVDLP